ncbi:MULTISPECIES: protein DpdF [unclassified Photobacterium]|uniref:protein DpdF n=1 Tax=unclassified Photobacterium TaxID=2628852 RepID=UPI0022AACF33|nr:MULTISPECIES: protein DpdF [unclassified Photobacterium]
MLENLKSEVEFFFDSQFKSRFIQALDSPELTLTEFWYLTKDLLATEDDLDSARLRLGKRPTKEELAAGISAGLKFDPISDSVALEPGAVDAYADPIYKQVIKRYSEQPPHDPVLERLNLPFDTYTTPAQREAVRLTLASKPDATVIVNLPTGCGKTLITETLTAFSRSDELTVVVIPTTALALDQAKRMRKSITRMGYQPCTEYAWRGELSKDAKAQIKADILSGKQRVLFVSPESMVSGILPTLFKAVEAKILKNIVFDEAHLIDTWGDDFRPDFQKLGALLQALKKKGGCFRKVFLSATFTDQSLVTIKALFGDPQTTPTLINGAFLRPEPICIKQEVSRENYIQTVVDKVLSSPKPLLVYASTKTECDDIYQELSEKGVNRVRLFTGDTEDTERSEIIEQWDANNLDIIVATTAFGVGMDKGDVRTVIHAGLSQNIDGYYQEIGRSGRDGKASYCEVIYHQEQLTNRSHSKKIGIELGFKRWNSMWKQRSEVGDNLFEIQVNNQADHIEKNSDGNETWNWKTLLLMQRAGLLYLCYPDASLVPDNEDDWAKFWSDFTNKVVVEVLHDRHVIKTTWEGLVDTHRSQENTVLKKRSELLLDWVMDKKSLGEVLQVSFTLDNFMPLRVCGRRDVENGRATSKTLVGDVFTVSQPSDGSNSLEQYYFDSTPCSVERLMDLFKLKVNCGEVTTLVCSENFLQQAKPYLDSSIRNVWFYTPFDVYEDNDSALYEYSKFIVQDEVYSHSCIKVPFTLMEKFPSYFFGNSELKDPFNPHRRWWESSNNIKNINTLTKI